MLRVEPFVTPYLQVESISLHPLKAASQVTLRKL